MIITMDGDAVEHKDYRNEKELQEFLAEHPEVLKEEDSELWTVKREITTEAGRVDIMDLASDGTVTIVEVKLDKNHESRRDVLAQIFDYISALSEYSYYELNKASNNALNELIDDRDAIKNSDDMRRLIEENLHNCLVRLVIAVDKSNEDLKRLIEFVTEHSDLRVDLIEIKKYFNNGEYIYNVNSVVRSRAVLNNRVRPKYPLLDAVVEAWKQSGNSPEVHDEGKSWRQIRIDGWPVAVHYEFVTFRGDSKVHIRLDNELAKSSPKCEKLAEAMSGFEGKVVHGRELKSRPYSPSDGHGKVIYVTIGEDEVDEAPEIMKELIELTKDTVDAIVGRA